MYFDCWELPARLTMGWGLEFESEGVQLVVQPFAEESEGSRPGLETDAPGVVVAAVPAVAVVPYHCFETGLPV